MNRIQAKFEETKAAGRGALVIFITAGDPNLEATYNIALAIAEVGGDVIELGIPYSDPLADGPVIQAAGQRALAAGTKVTGVLECAARIRAKSPVPLVVMTCYNPILQFGPAQFAAQAKAAGIDGVLISDLPPEESDEWVAVAAAQDLATVFLVAPTTPPERVRLATERTTGFVYAVARAGVTGARAELPEDLSDLIARIREATDKPVAVGFGVSDADQVRAVCSIADGAIVGSAVVKVIAAKGERDGLVDEVAKFVGELAEGTHPAG
jgi:tryptophan synthase alpha chain